MALGYVATVVTAGPPAIFLFTDAAPTDIYALSLHDALPICAGLTAHWFDRAFRRGKPTGWGMSIHVHTGWLRSEEHTSELSHGYISYAVSCLKKKTATYPPFGHGVPHTPVGAP